MADTKFIEWASFNFLDTGCNDKTYQIKFEYDGKKAESEIAIFIGDPT
ncbi:hypothetical protein [Neobacillus vireti]|nr:hypothetical protein [Neobacillus vireti]